MVIKDLAGCLVNQKNSYNTGVTFILDKGIEEFMPYSELYLNAKKIAFVLKENCKPKSEIVIQIKDNKQFINAFWGIIFADCIPVIFPFDLNNMYGTFKYMQKVWTQFESPFLLTTEDLKQKIFNSNMIAKNTEMAMNFANRILTINDLTQFEDTDNCNYILNNDKDDIAMIEYSSGSTGRPKGVILSNENILCNINQIINHLKFSSTDSSANWLPLTFDLPLFALHIIPLYLGANQYHLDTRKFFDNSILWLDTISQKRITTSATPNFGLRHLLGFYQENLHYDWDFSNFRILINAAESVSLDLCDQFAREMSKYNMRKEVICPSYGMAEATLAISLPEPNTIFSGVFVNKDKLQIGDKVIFQSNREDAIWIASVGVPLVGCNIRVCDFKDNILPEGFMGELQIKGDNVIKGYYKNEKLTNNAFAKDGWFRTGDIVFVWKNNIYIIGRIDDMVSINGANVFLSDIEHELSLSKIENVSEVAACSFFDKAQNTYDIVVYYMTDGSEEVNKEEIEKIIKDIVWKCNHLHIREAIQINNMPKTQSGKIMRSKLSKLYEENIKKKVNEKSIALDLISIQKIIKKLCCEIFQISNIEINDKFFDRGADSKSILKLCEAINENDMPVSVLEIFENSNIKELSELIYSKINGQDEKTFCYCKLPQKYCSMELREDKIKCKKFNMNFENPESNFTLSKYIISAYAVSIFKVLECDQVYINTFFDKKYSFSQIELKLSEKEELDNILEEINSKKTVVQFNIEEIQKFYKSKGNNFLNVLLCNSEPNIQGIDLDNYFDLSLYYKISGNKLLFDLHYNCAYLREEMINLLYKYIIYIIRMF